MSFKLLFCVIALLFVNVAYAIQITRDIPYTYDGRQALDLFIPEDTDIPEAMLRPAAIIMHSGGWSTGSRDEMESIAEWFANQGFVVINVSYSLAPENRWPTQFADVIQGVWWLKENAERYKINSDKILAVGASAGGHLAAILGQKSVSNLSTGVDSEVHGIVSISGPWNLLQATTDVQLLISLLLPVDSPEARYLASPVFQISRYSPPVLIFHGKDDELVPFEQSKHVCEVYASKGLDHCFLIALEGGHTNISELDTAIIFNSIREFLNEWLDQ